MSEKPWECPAPSAKPRRKLRGCGMSEKLVTCPACQGYGYVNGRLCWLCDSAGAIYQSEIDEVEEKHRSMGFFCSVAES